MIASDAFLSTIEEASDDQRSALGVLRRYVRVKPVGKPVEKCELCSTCLSAEHRHLVDRRTRRLVCCCEACGLLFSGVQGAYRRVPQTVAYLRDFRLSDAQWESLQIPINLAFFYRSVGFSPPSSSDGGLMPTLRSGDDIEKIIAVYPSPAGLIESPLGLDPWQAIVDDNPRLGDLQPEVEALLVNRLRGRHLHYLVPIDECYRLSGLIRLYWRGLSGGGEVWEEVGRYFERLKEKSCSI